MGTTAHEQSYDYAGPDTVQQAYYLWRARRFARYLARVAPLKTFTVAAPQPPRLLDVGCGEGSFLLEAKHLGWMVAGTELDHDVARATAERTGCMVAAGDISRAETIVDDPRRPVLVPRSYQAVTLWGILEHVPDPNSLLTCCARMLAPGGVLVVETPNPRGLFRRLSLALARLSHGRVRAPLRQTLGAGHVVWYSLAGLQSAVERCGLKLVDAGGSRNSTRILLARWRRTRLPARWALQLATIVANHLAQPLGLPNQLHGAWRRGSL